MKTKTKSTVARRRVKRRQERVSHKKLRTLRSRKYARKTAKKVMRGGERIYEFEEEISPQTNIRKSVGKDGYGVLLYDEIPLSTPPEKDKVYRFPICVFFLKSDTLDVYIFFNKNVTGDEITLTVKHFLGIDDANFSIQPPITVSNDSDHIVEDEQSYSTWHFLGDTFVKLSKCESMFSMIRSKYCLETGVFQPRTALFEVATTTKHKMVIGDKDVKINMRDRDTTIGFLTSNDFRKKMRTSVQPNLFKDRVEELKTLKKLKINYPESELQPFLIWSKDYIDRQRIKKENYTNRELVYVPGEDRLLKVKSTNMNYLDNYTPEEIVDNIELTLLHGYSRFTINPLKIIDEVNEAKAKAAAEAKVAAEAKAAAEVTA